MWQIPQDSITLIGPNSRYFTALRGRYWDRTSDPHNVNVVLYR